MEEVPTDDFTTLEIKNAEKEILKELDNRKDLEIEFKKKTGMSHEAAKLYEIVDKGNLSKNISLYKDDNQKELFSGFTVNQVKAMVRRKKEGKTGAGKRESG